MEDGSTGNPFLLVEQDHRILVGRWEALVTALERAADRAIVRDCIEGLISCARDHFRNEEWAMREIAFPGYLKHKTDHQRLLKEADDMLVNFDTAFSEQDWTALATYFRHWISRHNADHDKDFHTFARRAGVHT